MNKFSIKVLFFSLIVSVIGISITYYLSVQIKTQLNDQNNLKLHNIAKQITIRLQDSIDMAVNDLQALQAFYSANSNPQSMHEFNSYMDVLNIESRQYIQALSWVPLVKENARYGFIKSIQKQYPNFTITERNSDGQLITSSDKAEYTPVTYISPYNTNKAAQGFNLSSNDTRRTSLHHARDNGKMTATAKIRLIQEKEESYGFLIIAPVYKEAVLTSNKEARKTNLQGYVTGVFRINNLMGNAKKQADKEGVILTLTDIGKTHGGLLYGEKNNDTAYSFILDIPDRHWQLDVSLNKALKQNIDSPQIVNWILILGIIISLLLALCVYALLISVNKSDRITRLSKKLTLQNNTLEITVQERTKSIAEKNEQLSKHVNELTLQRQTLSDLMTEAQNAKHYAEERSKDLVRSNKDLDDFAYVASHDLKAPLRGIDQLASWVAEDIEAGELDEVPENLRLMRGRVQRLESLLNDLLAYSRAHRQGFHLETITCQSFIEETFALVSPPQGFKLTIQGELPILSTVVAPFEQIVRNLLNNAIKHHHKTDGHIQVQCHEDEQYYTFSFKDDGPGIDNKNYDEIFKMFKTLKPRDEVEGSGMGLALIKKIVEFYNGKVYIESTVGEGSTFYFTWPKKIIDTSVDLIN